MGLKIPPPRVHVNAERVSRRIESGLRCNITDLVEGLRQCAVDKCGGAVLLPGYGSEFSGSVGDAVSMTRPDVIIVGGGIMGTASAYRLAEAGLSVTVLERSVVGAEASSAAAGILGPSVEAHEVGPYLRLGRRSRALHRELAMALRDEVSLDVGYGDCGLLWAAFDEAEMRALESRAEMLGTESEPRILSGDEARTLEPSLSPEVVGALCLPHEGQVDPRALLGALALAAERRGVVFRSGEVVRGVSASKQSAEVSLGAEKLEAERVIVAAGSWTSLVPGLSIPEKTIRPVRGQILATKTRPPVFRRVVFGAGGYVLCRPDGRVVVGSTEEEAGFDKRVTFAGVQDVSRIATQLAPRLGSAPVLDMWANFRPATTDELPLVGPTSHERLLLASGHFRNGILMAPVTAEIVTGHVLGHAQDDDALALLPTRFEQ